MCHGQNQFQVVPLYIYSSDNMYPAGMSRIVLLTVISTIYQFSDSSMLTLGAVSDAFCRETAIPTAKKMSAESTK